MYTDNGDVQEFRYTTAVMNAFNGQGNGIAGLQDLDSQGWINGSGANVFVANHDTERGGSSLNSNSPSNEYYNAMIFSLAHPYGTPTILSSYKYSNYDDGAPNNGWFHNLLSDSELTCWDVRNWNVLGKYGHERLALPAPVGGCRWHDRLPQQRYWTDHELGVPRVQPDRLRPRKHWLRRHQQCGVFLDSDLHDLFTRRNVLRRRKRAGGVFRVLSRIVRIGISYQSKYISRCPQVHYFLIGDVHRYRSRSPVYRDLRWLESSRRRWLPHYNRDDRFAHSI
jgi:hypothetical protein